MTQVSSCTRCWLTHRAAAGKNLITKLASLAYLRQFERLQIVNLSGNPVAKDPSYRCPVPAAHLLGAHVLRRSPACVPAYCAPSQ